MKRPAPREDHDQLEAQLATGQASVRAASRHGYALILVLFFIAVSLLVLGGALNWSSTSVALTQRYNQYLTSLAAAEAATEKVLAQMSADFQAGGTDSVTRNQSGYRSLVPGPEENPLWSHFEFSDGEEHASQTYVATLTPWAYSELNSQFLGTRGWNTTYRILSNARQLDTPYNTIVAALKQDVQLASIPVFQFAVFSTVDVELCPTTDLSFPGRVHVNGNFYLQPATGAKVTFKSHVTTSGNIFLNKHPEDPVEREEPPGKVTFEAEHQAGVRSLNLPVGRVSQAPSLHAILEMPPANESPQSLLGQQRYFRKADLIILMTNDTPVVRSGAFNGFATVVPTNQSAAFLTNATFFNKREAKTVQAIEIDLARLKRWSETNTLLRPILERDVRCLYVADLRVSNRSVQSGVRLVNGRVLPSLGLTVATPNPLYVKGSFNAPSGRVDAVNSAKVAPASLVADALTFLSDNWDDTRSGAGLAARVAVDTVVNAALLGGWVPTREGHYSGGVENFPRFLEDWHGRTFAWNGSMVILFYSETAIAPWGATTEVYWPPLRQWSFNPAFQEYHQLPPATPELRTIIRADWAVVEKNTTG